MLEMAVIVGVLIALGQLMKNMGVPAKYIPAINLVLGIVVALLGGGGMVATSTLLEKIVGGVIIGLTASGLYDQKKITDK